MEYTGLEIRIQKKNDTRRIGQTCECIESYDFGFRIWEENRCENEHFNFDCKCFKLQSF